MKIAIFNGYIYPGLYFFNRGYIQNYGIEGMVLSLTMVHYIPNIMVCLGLGYKARQSRKSETRGMKWNVAAL